MEKYSVLMSIYNKVKTDELDQSINSILNQSYPPDQFVIVYDGPISTQIRKMIEDYSKRYIDIFTIVALPENHGLAYALDKGLEKCRNDLVMRMDSDDVSFSNRAEIQVQEFEKDINLALLGGNTQHFKSVPGDTPNSYSSKPIGDEEIRKTLRRNSAFSHPTVMFRKKAVDACGGYDPALRRSQDHDLFSKMIFQGYSCKNISDVVVHYRTDDNGVLRNRNKESCDARIIIQRRLLRMHQCSIIDYIYIVIRTRILQKIPQALFLRLYSATKEKHVNE